jgi:SAM-dependent methyltransferase
MKGLNALDWLVPRTARRALMRRAKRLTARPQIGSVRFGDLRRLSPLCADWGYGRGTPIDRYYIERFLAKSADDIHGRVIEVGTDEYTRRFGGDRVDSRDVLHVTDAGPHVTIVGDLTTGAGIPADSFDCAIVTQTLHFVYDVHAVVRTLHRLLKPGGVALVTVPGITKISPEDMVRWGQYWSFTSRSAPLLFQESFTPDGITIERFGNVLTATAFLQGIAVEELTDAELEFVDPSFETLLGIRAQRVPA